MTAQISSSLRHAATLVLVAATVAPVQTTQAVDPPVNAVQVGHWDGYNGNYCDIWADGDYVYLPNWAAADGQDARVHVLDISDPANPTLDETLFIPAPNTSASPQDVKVGDGLLFVGLEADPTDGVAIFDVRDPANRAFLTYVTIAGFEALHNVFYDSGFLYFAEGTSFVVVDLTGFDPDNPPATIVTPKWVVNDVGTSFIHDITVAGGRLYAAAWDSGLWVYDITDVANNPPAFMGSVAGDNTHSMWPTADGKFVVTGEERSGGGIQVFEMTENKGLLTFALRDSLTFPTKEVSSVHNQFMVGNRIYNSWYAKGLQVFDVNATTGVLEFVASFDTSDSGLGNWGVYPLPGSNRVALSDGNDGCYIVAIGDNTAPIPAVSEWGLISMTLLTMIAASLIMQPRGLRVIGT